MRATLNLEPSASMMIRDDQPALFGQVSLKWLMGNQSRLTNWVEEGRLDVSSVVIDPTTVFAQIEAFDPEFDQSSLVLKPIRAGLFNGYSVVGELTNEQITQLHTLFAGIPWLVIE